jgi:predicted enzyme related to lactoylglutathione lyase
MGAPIVHIEFKSANFERTSAFYAKLFDWKTEHNASGSYMKLDSSDGPSTGWVRADLVRAPGPVAYLVVEDLAAKLDEVEQAGGRVLVRSLPFAGGGEIGLFADPDGNVVGLWKRKAAAGNGAPAAASKPSAKAAVAAKPAGKPAAKAKKKK